MRIRLDIASLAYKKQVGQIVLFAGDADFVPAAKLARRKGIDFILDPKWQRIAEDLQEHIDGLRLTCPRPRAPLDPGQKARRSLGRAWQGTAHLDPATPQQDPRSSA